MDYNKHTVVVSIIVPCYNQAKYLDEALQSVLMQTYTNWECILVNDGSTDETETICLKWVSRDDRFLYFAQKNQGVVKARNYGINKAIGEFILPLDSDDLISVDYIELALEEISANVNVKLVYSQAIKFGDLNEFWDLPLFSMGTLAKGNIIFNCALFRKSDWNRVGGYDVNLDIGYEDWEFWINILKAGGEVKQIPKVCFYYRIKTPSRNTNIQDDQFKRIYAYVSVKHADFFVNQWGSFHSLKQQINQNENENKKLKKLIQSKKSILKKVYIFGIRLYNNLQK